MRALFKELLQQTTVRVPRTSCPPDGRETMQFVWQDGEGHGQAHPEHAQCQPSEREQVPRTRLWQGVQDQGRVEKSQ